MFCRDPFANRHLRRSILHITPFHKIRECLDYETAGKNQTGLLSTAAARSEAPRQLPTICDEIHQLAGDTAQGNALGTLAACTNRIVGLTGTLLGGYADDLFNTLFRLEAKRMKEHGYEWGTTGRSSFIQDYGVLETITKIEPANNACSKAKTTSMVRRKPGASPLLFGEFLMQLCAFVFLEDISSELPPYEERLLGIPMDDSLRAAYQSLEEDIREALKKH